MSDCSAPPGLVGIPILFPSSSSGETPGNWVAYVREGERAEAWGPNIPGLNPTRDAGVVVKLSKLLNRVQPASRHPKSVCFSFLDNKGVLCTYIKK